MMGGRRNLSLRVRLGAGSFNTMKLTAHWAADIFPLNDSDIDRLAEDIKTNGQRQPIITYKGEILDGRTRYAACKKAGVEPITEEYKPRNGEVTDAELLALSWSLNEARRHLTTSQRACAAAEVMERNGVPHGGPRAKGQKAKPKIWTCFGISDESARMARELLKEAPKQFAQVKAGATTVGAAYETHRKTKEWEAAESERNSLAEIRAAYPDLAEQVENDKITLEEAKRRMEAEAAEKAKRESELSKITSGVLVAMTGLELAEDSLAEVKATVADTVALRQPHQLKEDKRRFAVAIEFLNRFLKATNERN